MNPPIQFPVWTHASFVPGGRHIMADNETELVAALTECFAVSPVYEVLVNRDDSGQLMNVLNEPQQEGVYFTDEERTQVLRYLAMNAQGSKWPIKWDAEIVKRVLEKIQPTTYSTVSGTEATPDKEAEIAWKRRKGHPESVEIANVPRLREALLPTVIASGSGRCSAVPCFDEFDYEVENKRKGWVVLDQEEWDRFKAAFGGK